MEMNDSAQPIPQLIRTSMHLLTYYPLLVPQTMLESLHRAWLEYI